SHHHFFSALSSDPFSQSGSPSHCHLFDSAHVFFTQVLSSLPSEQSSSLLHFQSKGIQRPLLHGNWDSSHFALAPSAAVHRQARASSRQSALQPPLGSNAENCQHRPPMEDHGPAPTGTNGLHRCILSNLNRGGSMAIRRRMALH
uniref:Uncharacterized protein n=1 Tax=Anas zonorhyncha TaxID=75864 RepID=A0A8B9ZMP6_9AVES